MIIAVAYHGDEAMMRAAAWIFGTTFLASGLADALMTRGKHVGWPMLALAGVLALASLL